MNRDHDPSAGIWFEVEERIEATPREVFPYLIDPQRYARWMGVEAELEARPGGVYRVRMSNDAEALGEFVAVEPFRRLVFTWGWRGNLGLPPGSSTVEITLQEDDGSTLIRLRHSRLPDEDARRDHAEGWEKYLARLGIVATGGDPGDDRHG
jgi:uncharacterized protein YndB with AHSA1/START domain